MSANAANLTPTVPTDTLEVIAQDQRSRIHESVVELRGHLHQTLDVRRQARSYVVAASAVAAGLGLMFGFKAAGMFSRPAYLNGKRC